MVQFGGVPWHRNALILAWYMDISRLITHLSFLTLACTFSYTRPKKCSHVIALLWTMHDVNITRINKIHGSKIWTEMWQVRRHRLRTKCFSCSFVFRNSHRLTSVLSAYCLKTMFTPLMQQFMGDLNMRVCVDLADGHDNAGTDAGVRDRLPRTWIGRAWHRKLLAHSQVFNTSHHDSRMPVAMTNASNRRCNHGAVCACFSTTGGR